MVILKKQNDAGNTFSDKNLICLLDIGCILLQKGFEFPDLARILNPEIVSYMKTYIDMTCKRLHSLYQRPHFLSNTDGKPISFFHGKATYIIINTIITFFILCFIYYYFFTIIFFAKNFTIRH